MCEDDVTRGLHLALEPQFQDGPQGWMQVRLSSLVIVCGFFSLLVYMVLFTTFFFQQLALAVVRKLQENRISSILPNDVKSNIMD